MILHQVVWIEISAIQIQKGSDTLAISATTNQSQCQMTKKFSS